MRDALQTLGKKISSDEMKDAVHVAVLPIEAGADLRPGDHIGIKEGKARVLADSVGIVDPFLEKNVRAGEWFWLMLYPRTITSLRHEWTHPSIETQPVPSAYETSMEFLKRYCSENYDTPSLGALLEAVKRGDGDEYLYISGEDAHGDIPSEIWDHVENVLGERITDRPKYYSCGC